MTYTCKSMLIGNQLTEMQHKGLLSFNSDKSLKPSNKNYNEDVIAGNSFCSDFRIYTSHCVTKIVFITPKGLK